MILLWPALKTRGGSRITRTSLPAAEPAPKGEIEQQRTGVLRQLRRDAARVEPQLQRPKPFGRAWSLQLPRAFTPDRR